MPLTVATVSGYMTKPDGSVLENGAVVFTLSGVAASDGYVVSSQPVRTSTDVTGFFTVELMPNDAYDWPTSYNVTGYEFDGVTDKPINGYNFGSIRVPVDGGFIQDLLPVPEYGKDNKITVIKGDSIYWQCVFVDDIRRPVNLTAATIECKFVKPDGTFETATIDTTGANEGKFVISANTADYTAGLYSVRLAVTNGGIKKTQVGEMRIIN